ncbi:N-acetylmuramoyl-L-alanine amidase [Hathewaya proteolytica DSM 3090]|uniref:N-acetylmuramoyl-L-alanine amidase n=1 Tax=Hathewaya proteolytica DSM 3090 TaxID=1121331 RepID=A0A1M6PXP5_9CLOT|nr:N-acetylmuramoyl-L-alanine amidase CwlD [Hathewaya proteolytica]SHK12765.1 N-acetylmuramoyl-L-alanine amidase [Hathewaya proteolytica DSM 3090]
MKKPVYTIILSSVLILISFLCIISFNHRASEAASSNLPENKIILIDAGHGGMDGGATSPTGTMEKHINLSISQFLREELEKTGYKVMMTRESDIGLYSDGTIRQKKNEDLNRRCALKKDTGCNMFISIHLNKFPESKYKGAQVWYSDHEESKELAQSLQTGLRNDLDPENKRQIKAAAGQYKILRINDTMPAVIVECGFLSNPQEEELLKTEEYQKKIAQSLAKSIGEYYNKQSRVKL